MQRTLLLLRRPAIAMAMTLAIASDALSLSSNTTEDSEAESWTVSASIIEATTGASDCAHSAGFAASRFQSSPKDFDPSCRYNRAVKINVGHVGTVALDGVRFWMAGARGTATVSDEQEWAAVTFDPSVTPDQRAAALNIVSHLYPVQWRSFTVVGAPAEVSWEATTDRARAQLGHGDAGEITLSRVDAENATSRIAEPSRYAAARRVIGMAPMRSDSQAYNLGPEPFRANRTAGLVVTIEMSSSDPAE